MLTRFYDAVAGTDGPVSGGIQTIPLYIQAIATNSSEVRQVNFPAGMGFEVTDIMVYSGTVASDPAITVGTTVAGTQIVASANITTAVGAMTIKDGTVAAGGRISVTVTTDAGDTIQDCAITIVGYPTSPPTSINEDGRA